MTLVEEWQNEGRVEGKAEATRTLAEKMLAKDIDPALVSSITGLSLEMLESL